MKGSLALGMGWVGLCRQWWERVYSVGSVNGRAEEGP